MLFEIRLFCHYLSYSLNKAVLQILIDTYYCWVKEKHKQGYFNNLFIVVKKLHYTVKQIGIQIHFI